jgi:uncharacterized protein YutE (UPF0331/DUF86 family)
MSDKILRSYKFSEESLKKLKKCSELLTWKMRRTIYLNQAIEIAIDKLYEWIRKEILLDPSVDKPNLDFER